MISKAAWAAVIADYYSRTRETARQAEIDLARIFNSCLSPVQHLNQSPAGFPAINLQELFDVSVAEMRRRTPAIIARLLTQRIDQSVRAKSISTTATALEQSLRRTIEQSDSGQQYANGVAGALATYIRSSISEPRRIGDQNVSAPWI